MLTGFLGSGKTTLLQKLIDEYADHKIGILINALDKSTEYCQELEIIHWSIAGIK